MEKLRAPSLRLRGGVRSILLRRSIASLGGGSGSVRSIATQRPIAGVGRKGTRVAAALSGERFASSRLLACFFGCVFAV